MGHVPHTSLIPSWVSPDLITYKSGKSDRKFCLICKFILIESLTYQHRALVMDIRLIVELREKDNIVPKD
ncbi:hypothetical protein Lal_00000973 [Lupinus albus]|nr:hypothetical protein Lal_00000973 [Lupinus albus]